MGKLSEVILPIHRDFIADQHLFFVATSPLGIDGHVNLSPKGIDGFRVLSDSQVGYMDLIGSGNETSAHLVENGRVTFMFCAMAGPPQILRLYGRGKVVLPGTADWNHYSTHFRLYPATRQLIVADISLVQTSCGFGVPLFEYSGERTQLVDWADKKGVDGLETYVKEKNLVSLDGLPTAHSIQKPA